MQRKDDGGADDANYGTIDHGYAQYCQPEPAIEALIRTVLGDARPGPGAVLRARTGAALLAERLRTERAGGRGTTLPAAGPHRRGSGRTDRDPAGADSRFLDPGARLACSAWSFVAAEEAEAAVDRLRIDLASGAWEGRYRQLRTQASFDGSL